MSLQPVKMTMKQVEEFKQRLAAMTDWEIRVLASLLDLEKQDHDTSDLAGLPALLDTLLPSKD
jgi:hypothetical protein